MNTTHAEKYQNLADRLGWADVLALVPFPLERVRKALDAGDDHLNTLPLIKWDRAALGDPNLTSFKVNTRTEHGCAGAMADLFRKAGMGHSQSDGVCVLKHVARVEALKIKG